MPFVADSSTLDHFSHVQLHLFWHWYMVRPRVGRWTAAGIEVPAVCHKPSAKLPPVLRAAGQEVGYRAG